MYVINGTLQSEGPREVIALVTLVSLSDVSQSQLAISINQHQSESIQGSRKQYSYLIFVTDATDVSVYLV